MFIHRHIARQIIFVNPAKRPQKVARAGPHALCGIGMDLTNAVAIVIACPFVFSMIDRDMLAWNLIVPCPFIGIDSRVGLRETNQVLLQSLTIRVLDDTQPNGSALTPDRADDGRTVIIIGAVPALFVGPTAGWVRGIIVFSAFFPPNSETFRRFQLWYPVAGSRVGAGAHYRADVGADDAPYHRLSPTRVTNWPWVHPCTRLARAEPLAPGAVACSQTVSRYIPYKPFDTLGSDTALHDSAGFVQRRQPASRWHHIPDSTALAGESVSVAKSHRIRRRRYQELESPCRQGTALTDNCQSACN
jgi:hypothetical protein